MTNGLGRHPKMDENHEGMARYAHIVVKGNPRKDFPVKGVLTKNG
jgi:hypothetical protein